MSITKDPIFKSIMFALIVGYIALVPQSVWAAKGGKPPPEPVPEVEIVASPASPQADPAFRKAKGRVDNRAENQSQHGTGEDKSTITAQLAIEF